MGSLLRTILQQGLKVLMNKTTFEKLSKTPAGRKYALALMIFVAATLLCAVTPVLSVFVFKTQALVLLTGSEWVTVVSMLGAFYFSANVAQKKLTNGAYESAVSSSPIKEKVEIEEDKKESKDESK